MRHHHTSRARRKREFDHIARYQTAAGEKIAKVLPGDYYVTAPPELISTLLGSCVAACIRDPSLELGGMNHFMLPEASPEARDLRSHAGRYGVHAMENLINGILRRGGQRERLEVKIFGGGSMGRSRARIGEQNATFVEEYLRREGFVVAARDLGGEVARRLIYEPGSGLVQVMKLPPMDLAPLVNEEVRYERSLERALCAGSVELFDEGLR